MDTSEMTPEERKAAFWAMPIPDLEILMLKLADNNRATELGMRLDAMTIYSIRTKAA